VGRVETCDIVVIGGGSAPSRRPVAAREAGAQRVVMLEKAPESEYGGNAGYSGTGFRFVHTGARKSGRFIPEVDDAVLPRWQSRLTAPTSYMVDLDRMAQGRMNRELAQALSSSRMRRFTGCVRPASSGALKEHAKVDGKRYFEVASRFHVAGGGPGQLAQWRQIAENFGIEIRFESPVCACWAICAGVEGVAVSGPAGRYDLMAKAVIACAGGFQANPEMRARYLAGNTDMMKVRGTKQRHRRGAAHAARPWRGAGRPLAVRPHVRRSTQGAGLRDAAARGRPRQILRAATTILWHQP